MDMDDQQFTIEVNSVGGLHMVITFVHAQNWASLKSK